MGEALRPADLGLPFPEWRPSQWDAIQLTRSALRRKCVVVAEMPTGCGKSGVAAALAVDAPVTVLVATLGLLDQYVRDLGFTGLRGRQEYPCAHPAKVARWEGKYGRTPTAYDCLVSPMSACPYAASCAYLRAREEAKTARKLVVTYKMAALSPSVRNRSGFLVMDEAHDAAEQVLEFGAFSISGRTRYLFDLPRYPMRYRGVLEGEAKEKLKDYLRNCMEALKEQELSPDELHASRAGRLRARIGWLFPELDGTDFFLEVTPRGLSLRPLDAKPVASRLWSRKRGVLMMSATLGRPSALLGELGLRWPRVFRSYPHIVPRGLRPVFNLRFPRMTKENLDAHPALYRAQAVAIAKFIGEWPPSWRGLVLTKSLEKVRKLRRHLGPLLDGRLWDCDAVSPRARVLAFLHDPWEGIVAVETAQGWGQGLDLHGERARFLICAGVPFPVPTDPYELARISRPGGRSYADFVSYSAVPQMCGRVTRAHRNGSGGFYFKVAALADGSALTSPAMRYYPSWFKEAVVVY